MMDLNSRIGQAVARIALVLALAGSGEEAIAQAANNASRGNVQEGKQQPGAVAIAVAKSIMPHEQPLMVAPLSDGQDAYSQRAKDSMDRIRATLKSFSLATDQAQQSSGTIRQIEDAGIALTLDRDEQAMRVFDAFLTEHHQGAFLKKPHPEVMGSGAVTKPSAVTERLNRFQGEMLFRVAYLGSQEHALEKRSDFKEYVMALDVLADRVANNQLNYGVFRSNIQTSLLHRRPMELRPEQHRF